MDTASIINVIGNIYKKPDILDRTDKYTITERDFPEQFHKVVISAIVLLYEQGVREMSLNVIEDFLQQHPKSEACFKLNKGDEWLVQAAESANENSFSYYYQRLKKFTLLREFAEAGVDVAEIYDVNNILDTKKKQIQEEWLDNHSLSEVSQKITDKINGIVETCVDNTFAEIQKPGDGLKEYKEHLKIVPAVGLPLYGPIVNTLTRGARLGCFYVRSATSGVGKAIPNSTLIPTPLGWRQVGTIRPGDELFGQDGKPTKVLAIHPQLNKKRVYAIHFSDGRIAECCEDHLWEYWIMGHGDLVKKVASVKDILAHAARMKNGFKGRSRFKVRLNEPVQYSEKRYSLPPYTMGAFIGDGSFRYDKQQKGFTFSTNDTEMLDNILTDLNNKELYYKKNSDFNYNYTFKNKNNPKHNIWVEEFLKDYPELWNTKSETKFIPRDYLQGSIEQRFELLRGLLDTDGHIDKKGRVQFITVSPYLKDNVIELCRSLGFITSIVVDKRPEKYTTGECYQIHIQTEKNLKPQLFKLTRKVDIAKAYAQNGEKTVSKKYICIEDIIETDRFEEMTCFTVDNKDHLFLMNDFICTHNTRCMVADACYVGCDEIYDNNLGWRPAGAAEPCCYISTEQTLEEIQEMMLAFISGVNQRHIHLATYIGDEEPRVDKAIEILERSKVFIICLPDFGMIDVENLIKRCIREYGVRYVFFDYLQSSLKILSEITSQTKGMALREDQVLYMLSRHLKDLAVEYDVFIETATQISGDYREIDVPDQRLLRGSKSIADPIDFGAIMLQATSKDLEKLQEIINSGGFQTPNIKMSIYKNRGNEYTAMYLWINADPGACRYDGIFCTDWNYNYMSIEDLQIQVQEEKGAF